MVFAFFEPPKIRCFRTWSSEARRFCPQVKQQRPRLARKPGSALVTVYAKAATCNSQRSQSSGGAPAGPSRVENEKVSDTAVANSLVMSGKIRGDANHMILRHPSNHTILIWRGIRRSMRVSASRPPLPYFLSSFKISRAAFAPDPPVKPAPGCVPEPHR
jgi:hypothetical protein